MLLTLRPTDATQRPACAALLRGSDPAAWLREISRWQLPASRLRCYLVPESLRSVAVAGLLVVAEGAELPPDVLEPYGVEAGRLYVPVQAALWPATTPAELAAALLWPRQLLQASGELVGFDTADELPLADLLRLPPPRPTDWTRARPAPPLPPPLRQLRVAAPSAADVVQQLQAAVAPAPLTELPGLAESRPGWGRRLLGWLHRALLRLALAASRLGGTGSATRPVRPAARFRWQPLAAMIGLFFGSMFALGLLLAGHLGTAGFLLLLFFTLGLLRKMTEGNNGVPPAARPAAPRAGAGSRRPGWLRRAESWLNRRLDDLEQERQTELQRLLQLFRDNPAEALRYAIPLDGRYLGRGTAAPGARLGRQRADFDLGRLGGGQATDVWHAGPYAFELRQQYLAAARHEAAAGRHRQAAYILAHLLADYRAAAQVLAEGGHYREAAALYRDHLHDQPAAAGCLEQGGLLLEAADLYAGLGQPEKAGDLHQQLDQPAQAARYYEQAAAAFLTNRDHPEAARVLAAKLADPARAQALLLQGWDAGRQPELCLQRYFELAAAQPAADLPARVQAVYRQHTPPTRRGALLRVLAQVVGQHPAALPAARELAYDAIGQETAAGNFAHLPLLRPFVPDDPLLPGDLSRFQGRQPRPAVAPPGPAGPHLDPPIEWRSAVSHRQQWLAVGLRDGRLHLARGNWHGKIGYYSWTTQLPGDVRLHLLAAAHHSVRVLLRCSEPPGFTRRVLPATRDFAESLTLEYPGCLPPPPAPAALLPGGGLASLRVQGHTLAVQQYSPTGQWESTFVCDPQEPVLADLANWPANLLAEGGRFYTHGGSLLGWLAGEDDYRFLDAGSQVFALVRSPYPGLLLLAAVTAEAVLVWNPTVPGAELHLTPLPAPLQGGAWLSFVAPHYLLVSDGQHSALFWVANPEPALVRVLPPADELIIAALPTSHHRQFALLEASGRLTLHRLDDE